MRLWIMVVQERHIVRASQDAAVSGLGEEDHLPVQAGERRGWRVLAAEFPVNETVISWCGTPRYLGYRRPQPRAPAQAVRARWESGRLAAGPAVSHEELPGGWASRYLMVRSWR